MIVAEKEVAEKKEKVEVHQRDYAIDLIRIYACITVILLHLSLHIFNIYDVQVDWSRLFEKSFFTEGVPLFFMITGFFIANGRSYKKIWKSTFFKILVPTAFYIVISQIFFKYFVRQETFWNCLKNWKYYINLNGIVESILKCDVSYLQGICDHLWYIFSYVKIIIWVPVLWLLCKENETSKLARRIMIAFQAIKMILIDIQRFYVLPTGEITFYSLIDSEIMYVLLGYEMFTYKDKIKGNTKLRWISLMIFFITNIVRYKLEQQLMILNSYTDILGRETFVGWKYTSLNIITGIFTFAFFYSFEIKHDKIKKFLSWVSDKTFGIYLIHYLILVKVDLFKFEPLGKLWQEVLYLALGLICVFWGSILIVVIIREIKTLLKKLIKKLYPQKQEG